MSRIWSFRAIRAIPELILSDFFNDDAGGKIRAEAGHAATNDNASVGDKRSARFQADSFSELLRQETAGNIGYEIRIMPFVIHLSYQAIHREPLNARTRRDRP